MSQFVIVDNGQSCDDLENYDFIETLDGCTEALNYFYENPIDNYSLKPNKTVYDFSNPSDRPFGCYWYKWTKKLVHPRSQVSRDKKSDNTKRQVCKKVEQVQAGPTYTKTSCLSEYLGAVECQTTGDYAGSPSDCKPNHEERSFDGFRNWNCSICLKGYVKNIETGECEPEPVQDYIGNMTESGILCQNWSVQTPHTHIHTSVGNHNKCANPDNTKRNGVLTPWCYTIDSNKRWDYCDPNNPVIRDSTINVAPPPASVTSEEPEITRPVAAPEPVETPVPEPVIEPPAPEPVVETPAPEPVVETPAPEPVVSVPPTTDVPAGTLPATRIPYCRIDQGVLEGQDVVITEYAFICPIGSTIFCPTGSSLDQFGTNCVSPSGTPPNPLCRPDETRIEFTGECSADQIIEEVCKNNIQCVTNGDNCLCPNESDIASRTCRNKIIKKEEKTGVFDCGEYTLACPDGYTLDNSSKLCILNQ